MIRSEQLTAAVELRGLDPKADVTAPIVTTEPTPPAKRRLVAGVLGLALVAGLGGFSMLLRDNAAFAKANVARQLDEQEINFKPVDALSDEERGHACLMRYAGLALTTGDQARCYANDFIGVHLKKVAQGQTFSQMRAVQEGLRAQITDAQARNDPSVPDLQRKLAEVTGKRQTLFEGETMRGLLMTSYGFSALGAKADQAAAATSLAGIALAPVSLLLVGSGLMRRRARP